MTEPIFSLFDMLSILRTISNTYLCSKQFDVTIEESDARGNSNLTQLDMPTFLTKAIVRHLVARGVRVADAERALRRLDAPDCAYPNDKGLTVLAHIMTRFSSADDSPVRAER
jgi:hypothetical protein